MNESASNTTLQTLQNFDLSIVILLDDKRWDTFIRLFPAIASYYQRNGIEVIAIMGNTLEKEVILTFIKHFPMIDWKVIQCFPGNPAQGINTGIRQSSKQYILLLQADWEFQNDVIYCLRENLSFYPKHYAVGQPSESGQPTAILAPKECFEQVAGLDENIPVETLVWDNLQRRMELAGIRKLFYPDVVIVQQDNILLKPHLPEGEIFKLLLPNKITANQEKWGCNHYAFIYDWENKPFAEEQCKDYLAGLVDYHISDSDIFNRNYQLIALIPAYQESELIADCLRSVEKHCDGIIVLDDESTDCTYELIQSDKLLLKAKKKRTEFNDKQNRNILLDLAYFFRSEWFIFIDADERFDERFVDLSKTMKIPNIDIVGLWIANLWDSMETYRTDMMDSNPISKNGLWFRWRMFRNKGRMQITGMNKLHFKSVPYLTNKYISQTLLLHVGYLTLEKRNQKYSFYKNEDQYQPNEFYYNDILSKTINIQRLEALQID